MKELKLSSKGVKVMIQNHTQEPTTSKHKMVMDQMDSSFDFQNDPSETVDEYTGFEQVAMNLAKKIGTMKQPLIDAVLNHIRKDYDTDDGPNIDDDPNSSDNGIADSEDMLATTRES